MIKRALIIKRYKEPSVMTYDKITEMYGLTEEQIDDYIETGKALIVDGKEICFDEPII